MSFVQRELDRIFAALASQAETSDYDSLYAAQQALAWALEPTGIKSPFSMIRGTQEAKEDCSEGLRPKSF